MIIPAINRLKQRFGIRNSWVHFPLLVGFGLSLLAHSVSSGFPPPLFSVGFVNEIKNVDTTEFCNVLKSGLKDRGLAVSFHLKIPRDQNDYQLFRSSNGSRGNFFMINEQRQIVFYPGEASGGYELTDPGPEFYDEILHHQKDNEGRPIVDLVDSTIYFEQLETDGVSNILVYGLSGEPAPPTVIKTVSANVFEQTLCEPISEVGLRVIGASGSIEVGVIGKSTGTEMRRRVGLWRALSCLTAIAWAIVFSILRGKNDQQDKTIVL